MGEPPAPREGATAIFLEEQGRLVVFGGTPASHTNELWILDGLGPATAVAEPVVTGLPQQAVLHQNYPNPFNAGTTISFELFELFELFEPSEVRLRIHDQLGRDVRTLATGFRAAGTHRILWDGTDDAGKPAGSGTYFYQLDEAESDYRKLLILR